MKHKFCDIITEWLNNTNNVITYNGNRIPAVSLLLTPELIDKTNVKVVKVVPEKVKKYKYVIQKACMMWQLLRINFLQTEKN